MQLAERVPGLPIASVEHDGVVFWFKRESYNEANLMAQVRRVSQGLAFAVKALRNPVELARELYLKRVSGLDSIAFLDNWQVAKSAVGTNTFRETSHSFTLVLRDFYSDILFKNADDIVELFTTRGVWILCRNVKDLDDAIARDCKWLWAPSGPARPGEMPRVPPTHAWHSPAQGHYASRSESQPLDAQCRFKLLFPPAEDDPPLSGNGLQLSHRRDTSRSAR